MAYVSTQAEDVVLSREAMESLKLVSNLDDRVKSSVNLLSNSSSPEMNEEDHGSSLHDSRRTRLESTPAGEAPSRNRSAAQQRMSDRAVPARDSCAGGPSKESATTE